MTTMWLRSQFVAPLAVAIAALLWYALARQYRDGSTLEAALVAAMACWLGVLAGKVLGWTLSRTTSLGQQEVVAQATLGMVVRMAFPISLCGMAALQGGRLVEGGVIYAMLVVYPVSLAVETISFVTAPRGSANT
jgi:hypothetical protein